MESAAISRESGYEAPSYKTLPLMGSVVELVSDPLSLMERLSCVESPVVKLPMPLGKSMFFINSPEAAYHVLLGRAGNYSKSHYQRRLLPMTGEGLIFVEGEEWVRRRKLIAQSMTPSALPPILESMSEVVGVYLDRWTRQKEVNLSLEGPKLALDMLMAGLFGNALSQGERDDLRKAVDDVQHHVGTTMFVGRAADYFPSPSMIRCRRAISTMSRIVSAVVARRGEACAAAGILGHLASSLSGEVLEAELKTLLLTGHETIGSAVAWLLREVANDRELQKNLRENGASKPDLAVATVKEALRLYPSAWWISRTSLDADIVEGFRVPGGADIIISPWAMHRKADLWEDPRTFRPARFMDAGSSTNKCAYLPFGFGPRICVGASLSMSELKMVLVEATRRSKMSVRGNAMDVRPDPKVTLCPGRKIMVSFDAIKDGG